jgi:hypothetical protein
MYCAPASEDMASLNDKDRKWLAGEIVNQVNVALRDNSYVQEKISAVVESFRPKGWEKARRIIQELAPAGGIIAIVAILLAAAVALGIALISRYDTEATFRGKTDQRLTDIEQQLVDLRALNSSARPDQPQNQKAAKQLVAEARAKKIPPISTSAVVEAGQGFVSASSMDQGAWDVAVDFAAYRTSQNPERSLGDYYPFGSNQNPPLPISRFIVNYPLDKGYPAFTTSKARVKISQSARLEPITGPAKQDGPDGPLSILGVGGAIGLDGVYARHVVFQGTEIYYKGGALNLYEVVFVNCVFHLENNPITRSFAQAVISAPTISFVPTQN